jgi:hypothetical protein
MSQVLLSVEPGHVQKVLKAIGGKTFPGCTVGNIMAPSEAPGTILFSLEAQDPANPAPTSEAIVWLQNLRSVITLFWL